MATITNYLKMANQLGAAFKTITNRMNQTKAAAPKLPLKIPGGKNLIPKGGLNIISNIADLFSRGEKSGSEDEEKKSREWLKNVKAVAGQYLTIKNLKSAMSKTVGRAIDTQSLKDQFIARAGNVEIGTNMFETFKAQAIEAGQDVNKSLQNALSFHDITKNSDNLLQINDLINRAAAFDPSGKGLDNAASLVQSAVKGDTSEIQKKFGMNDAAVKGTKIEELGKAGDVKGVIAALEKLFELRGMGEEAYNQLMDLPTKQLEKLSNTLSSSFATAGEGAIAALAPLFTMLNEAFAEGKFDFFFNALYNSIALLASITSSVAEFIMNNLDTVKNIMVAVGLVALFVGAQFLIAWIQAAWPLLLIIGIIALIIAVLNDFGISTNEIVGFIAGLFMGFVATAWNAVAILWNAFLSFAEFLANLFIDPVYAIHKLFYDFSMGFYTILYDMVRAVEDFAGDFTKLIVGGINGAIKGLNAFTGFLNKIFGDKFGEIKLLDEDNVHALSDGVKNIMDGMLVPKTDKDVFNLDKYRMDDMDIEDQFNKGNQFGSTLFDQSEKDDKKRKDMLPQNDWAATPGPKNIDGVGKVDEIGKINDSVDISSEDIKMMRELAEMKNIQNFVSLAPSITFGDTHVRNESDLETIFVRITEKLDQEIATSVNAVYT